MKITLCSEVSSLVTNKDSWVIFDEVKFERADVENHEINQYSEESRSDKYEEDSDMELSND